MKTLIEAATFDATIKVPEDGIDLVEAATVEPDAIQKLANRTKFLNDNKSSGAATSTDNGIPRFDGTGGKTLQTSALAISDAGNVDYISQPTRTIRIAAGSSLLPNQTATSTAQAVSVALKTNTGGYVFDLTPYLRSGMTITALTARVLPGAARATASNRMQLRMFWLTGVDFTGLGGTFSPGTRDDGTAAEQNITESGPGIGFGTLDRSDVRVFAFIDAGNNAATSNDLVMAFTLTVLDPGPRNH